METDDLYRGGGMCTDLQAMDALVKAASDVHFVVAKTLSDSFQARSELNAGQASM